MTFVWYFKNVFLKLFRICRKMCA